MNNPEALNIYGELLLFREHSSLPDLLFDDPSYWKQAALCTAAHSLNLEYEYRLSIRQARISRPAYLRNLEGHTRTTKTYTTDQLMPGSAHRNIALSQQDSFDEPFNNAVQHWEDMAESQLPARVPSISLSYADASATSSLSEYSDASLHFGPAFSRPLPQPSNLSKGVSPALQALIGSLESEGHKSHNERSHKCTVCDKRFRTLNFLQTHSNSHTSERRRKP
jgi:hypothetical protein